MLPALNIKLLPKLLRDLKPGTRIVSHAFAMGDWKPDQTLEIGGRAVYFWTIPARGTAAYAAGQPPPASVGGLQLADGSEVVGFD